MLQQLPSETLSRVTQNAGWHSYLLNMQETKPPTPNSWWYENLSNEECLDMVLELLKPLSSGSKNEQRVYEFDLAQKSKWGPQGGHPPITGERLQLWSRSFVPQVQIPFFHSLEWRTAKRSVVDELKRAGLSNSLRPRAPRNVVKDMQLRDTLGSNSGDPNFTKRRNVVEKELKFVESGEWRHFAATGLTRFYNNKLRGVWMFPMSTNIVEGQYVQPALAAVLQRKIPIFTPNMGYEFVRKQIHEWFATGLFISASDFSRTDETFQLALSLEAADVLFSIFGKSAWGAIEDSLIHMHSIPIIVGPDSWLVGSHGVASGSTWTNFIETVFDWIFARLWSLSGAMAIGDDLAYARKEFTASFPDEISKAASCFNLEVNTEKVTNEKDAVKYLQRLHIRDFLNEQGITRGIYPLIRAAKSMRFPERFHDPEIWSSDLFCMRIFSILENCIDHPLYSEFAALVLRGQKDLPSFALKDNSQLDRIQALSRQLPGFNETYNQEKMFQRLSQYESIARARAA